MELGKDVADEALQSRIDNLAPNKCCTLIYTVSFHFSSLQFKTVVKLIDEVAQQVCQLKLVVGNILTNLF